MNVHLIILLLTFVGVGDSLYLNYERRRKRPPVCVIGHGCGEVWESPYSTTLGISNEILGIIFYTTLAVIEWTLLIGDTSALMGIGEALFLAVGSLASCYFVFLEWRVIRAWCFWCTLSAIIVWTMTALAFFL